MFFGLPNDLILYLKKAQYSCLILIGRIEVLFLDKIKYHGIKQNELWSVILYKAITLLVFFKITVRMYPQIDEQITSTRNALVQSAIILTVVAVLTLRVGG